ncbi:MAG: hypothetical protein M1814_006303 [Vezdaea aestivalis]|nr:MAG: hypothetical protein M1814_006303 [Vezdaea aestivalis]
MTSTKPSSQEIEKSNGLAYMAPNYYPVVIIGAGNAGIAMGCQLKEKLGFDQFRIFERQSCIGGTWSASTGQYPGIRCDIPAIFYSFSFCPHPGGEFHPSGPAILDYLRHVCHKYQLVDKIQLNTDVREAVWLEDEGLWEVRLRLLLPGVGDLSEKQKKDLLETKGSESVYFKTEVVRCKVLVSGVGGFVEPRSTLSELPGYNSFEGPIIHSARWDKTVDLRDKDVTVVGTGCSAAQIVPEIVKSTYGARSVTQIMRTAPWVVPRLDPPGGDQAWAKWSPIIIGKTPGLGALLRMLIFLFTETDFRRHFGMEEKHKLNRAKAEQGLLHHMRMTVPEKYHKMLTPHYSFCCKRRISDNAWFPSLNNPKVELVVDPLSSIQPRHIILGDSPGRKISADVIVLANGFDVTSWLHPLKIYGRGGKEIQDIWNQRGGPQAYLGNQMDGFPNFFIVFGPNTATGHSSVILAIENMVQLSLKFIKLVLRDEARYCEVKRQSVDAYTADIQKALKDTVINQGGCVSWYRTEKWNATVYP